MRIALVQMPPTPRDTPPYEMALTTAILRKAGHEVRVFDINNQLYHEVVKQRPFWKFKLTDRSTDPSRAIYSAQKERFVFHADAILSHHPDVVVLKSENASTNAFYIAQILREKNGRVPIVSSGMYTADRGLIRRLIRDAENRLQTGRRDYPLDFMIAGEDDVALPIVLAALEGKTTSELPRKLTVYNDFVDATAGPHMENLDELPFYDFTDYDFMSYSAPQVMRFCVSRSCVMHCAFCQDWLVGRKFRSMSGERWFEEYRCQNSRHSQVSHYRHYDRLLNGDPAALDRFCDLMISHYREPPMAWGGDFIIRPEMSDELIGKMARAKCNNFGTGFESGSERVRAAVYKDFFTNELAARIFRSCRKYGIGVSLNTLIGLPAETRDDLMESIRFIEENAESNWEIRLTMPTVTVNPGTPLDVNPSRFGIRLDPNKDRDRWESLDGQNTYLERLRRFKLFCERVLELNKPRLVVNRRVVKGPAVVKLLLRECLEGTGIEPDAL